VQQREMELESDTPPGGSRPTARW